MPYLVEQPWRLTEEYFKKSDAVLFGAGAIHAHDHIPQGIDTITTDHFLKELEARTELLVVPQIPFGPMDNYMDYPGCISPSPETFKKFVAEVVRDLYKWGARRIFVINGHGGNTAPLLDVAFELRRQGGLMPVFEWWKNIQTIDPELDKAVNALPPGTRQGRRARTRGVETAVAMVLVPGAQPASSVKVVYSRELFSGNFRTNFATGVNYKGTFVPLPLGSRETTEWGETGTGATEDLGRRILDRCVEFMAGFIKEMCTQPLPPYGQE